MQKGDVCSFRYDDSKRGISTRSSSPTLKSHANNDGNILRKAGLPRGNSPSGKRLRKPCKDYLKGTCANPSFDSWHPPECQKFQTKEACSSGERCSLVHSDKGHQPDKKADKDVKEVKGSIAFVRDVRKLRFVLQEIESLPESMGEVHTE